MAKDATQPRIGISGASAETASVQAMVKRVSDAGGEPLLIHEHGKHSADQDFKNICGLVIMGNDYDIDPETYIHRYAEGDPRRCIHPSTKNEKSCEKASARASYENTLIRLALDHAMPMLCICGGMQRLNVLCGGTLHQHVPDMTGHDRLMQSMMGMEGCEPTLAVLIEPGTKLAEIAEKRISMAFVKSKVTGIPLVVMENSFRHQSIDIAGEGLRVCALSDAVRMKDGTSRYLVEAIEAAPNGPYAGRFLIGVQWHPEFGASEIGHELVTNLVQHATQYRVPI